MGGTFTAAPALALVLLVALSVAATANVSRRPPRTDRISRNLARDCEFSWSLMVVVVFSLLFFFSGGGIMLDGGGLRRRAVVLRLPAGVRRLQLRPLRRHQSLPTHCERPRFSLLVSFLLFFFFFPCCVKKLMRCCS